MAVANTATPTLTTAMTEGDLASKLDAGLNTTASAAGAVGDASLASGLASAADSSVGSVNAFKQGDVASSIGLGATAVSEAGGAATTDGTSANAAASNVSGTETTTVVGADGVEKEAAVVTDPATG